MADRHWTNEATRTVAFWLANNARDWTAQTTREIFDAEDASFATLAVIQHHAATALATEIEDGISGEAYTASIEDCDSDLATVDLLDVDYLQIATRLIEDLGCQDHDERGGFCAVCGFVRPHVFPCDTEEDRPNDVC
tara:strand:+ start:853 stop:1263 length:411 start_codon:yes stop_codon:yes gene_type:complete